MKHWTKRTAAVLIAGTVVSAGLTGCTSETVDNSEVVATVNGEEITYGLANFVARMEQASVEYYYENMLGSSMGADLWATEIEEDLTYEDSVKESIMESLQDLYLISQHAEEMGVTLTEEEETVIAEVVAEFLEDNALEDKELVSGEEEYVTEYLRLMTIQQKMDAPMKEGVDEEVSDEEAAQKSMKYVYFDYYTTDDEGNSVEMTDEEKEARIADAESFAEALNSDDADIDTLAEEYGMEVTTATFDSESTSPNADLIAAVDALETEGDATDAIETDYGYYVAVLTSLFDEEATEEEKLAIVEERKEEQYNALLESWKEEAEITVNEEVWAMLDLEDIGVTYSGDTEE